LKQLRDEVFKGDKDALVKAMCGSLWAALANRGEAFITEWKKNKLQKSREQQQQRGSYRKPKPEPKQPLFRRPAPRVEED
jgi:hypothetical protein